MTNLIIWLLTAYGITNIVVYGSIFNTPRNLINELSSKEDSYLKSFWTFIKNMTSCVMCFGFHCGWMLSFALYSPIHHFFNLPIYSSWFFDAALASGTVWGINSIVEWFEENRPSNR
jgi:hypothetical protein